jgi:putative permease
MTSVAQKAVLRERRVKMVFLCMSLIGIFALLVSVNNLAFSFILALVVYNLTSPIVDFFERRGFSRLISTSIPFVALSLFVIVMGFIFSKDFFDQIESLQKNYKQYILAADNLISQIEVALRHMIHFIELGGVRPAAEKWLTDKSVEFFASLPDIISRSLTISIMTPFLAFFMLLDGRSFMKRFMSLVPNNMFELALNLNHQVGSQIGGFIRARLIESLIVGFVVWMGLFFIGIPYSFVLGMFAGLINVVPYIGPVVGLIPVLLVGLGSGMHGAELLPILVVFGVAQVIDNVILVPFLVARLVNLHPITVVLAFLIGAQTLGVIGMIVCIPVVSTLKVTLTALYLHFVDFRST